MSVLFLVFITFTGYLIAYHSYGSFLARKIFKLNNNNKTPAHTKYDKTDYIPSKKSVMFGHHFTSIAGTGPIVGPAIGIIWGWVPAILWVFLGSIFMGAVHDFSCLVISMRNEGKSIADITEQYINPRVRLLFFIIVCLALWIVIAIFGLIIALLFARFPESVIAVWLEIPIALLMGYISLKKHNKLLLFTSASVLLMYGTIFLGAYFPFEMPALFSIPPTGVWTIILLTYAFFASILPVSWLLQPRDFLNAWQLYIAIGILCLGIIVTHFTSDFTITAPALNLNPTGAPPMLPFLFITIACGAISGFHSLVSSGTSSKQIAQEQDAKLVGFGSMLVEGGLATLVIIAVTAGIGLSYITENGETLTGLLAWEHHYGSWQASTGLSAKLSAVVIGCSNIISSLGIPSSISIAIIGVFIASFAGTTLDSATRIQRYIISELFKNTSFKLAKNKWGATGIAVISAAILAFSAGLSGKGALQLWPLFGAVNQLLAALALLVASLYLKKNSTKYSYLLTAIPCTIMLIITLWSSIYNQINFIKQGNIFLCSINTIILLLSVIIFTEGLISFNSNKKKYATKPN